jgi:hypothetical protein
MYYCHCGTCRKATGSAFATGIIVRAKDFVLISGQETLKAFESSPNKYRHFCGSCGSPIYSQAEKTKQIISVRCGTLNEDPSIRPSVHAYVASKAPWHEITDGLPQKAESFA